MQRKTVQMGVCLQRVVLILVLILSGCAKEWVSVPETATVHEPAESAAYTRALDHFNNDRYREALEGFTTFLRERDQDAYVDAALFKIGMIFRSMGRDDDAMSVLSRMVREYPDSPLVPDAMLEMLTLSYEKGDYASVVNNGTAYTASTDPTLSRSRFFFLIAQAYQAIGSTVNAARYTYRAWNTADEEEVAPAWKQLEEALDQLNTAELQELLVEVKNPRARSLLIYRLGMAFVLEENYDEAIAALQLFVDRYPEHPNSPEADEIILSIEERSRFTPYTVGCVVPLSGAYSVYGQRALDGIEMAFAQSNSAAADVSFQLFVQDSMSDADMTLKAVEALDRQRVGAILGPMIASESAAKASQARGIPIFVFTQREGIVDAGPYVFRNFITPRMQARSLVAHAVKEIGARRFAIVFPEEKYGRRYMNLFWDEVIEHDAVVTAAEAYDPEDMDFAEPVKKLAGVFYSPPRRLSLKGVPRVSYPLMYLIVNPDLIDSQRIEDPVERLTGLPLGRETIDRIGLRARDVDDQWNPVIDFDAVFIPDAPKKAGLIIPQLVYYDIRDVLLMGTNLWNSKALLKMSGAYMKDVLIPDGFFVESPSRTTKEFVNKFERIYGRAPGFIEAMAYDNAMMVFNTMRSTAADSRRKLKEELLETVDFDGITGQTSFFSNGEADKVLQLLGVENGAFVQLNRNVERAQ
jgi:ABC-type branched-subunit amino acid transport system substrate-binding protein